MKDNSKNSNSDYMIDPTFINISILIVLSSKNSANNATRDFQSLYYMPLVEIKDVSVVINNKPIFDQPLKNKQESYEKLVGIPRNDDYTAGNLLDHL